MRRISVFAAVAALSLSMLFIASSAQAQPGPGGMSNAPAMMKMMRGGMMGKCMCMKKGAGMMGGGMMMPGMMMRGKMMGPMMHGMMERGVMAAGIPWMTPEMKMAFMHAMMKTMIRSALQSPDIKSFLDKTAALRKELVLKRFECFEAFRNPKTTPARLEMLKSQMKALEKKIESEIPHSSAGAMAPMM